MLKPIFQMLSPSGDRGRLSILIFHRVLPRVDPLFPDELHVERFDSLCQWLKAWFNVLPLDLAVRQLKSRTLPSRALAITFDDGYADNHDIAMTVLRKHGLTATFFIATGFLDGGRMWNDTVIESIRHTKLRELDLASLGVSGMRPVVPLDCLEAKRSAIDHLIACFKYLPIDRRLALTQQLAQLANVEPPSDLMMRADQVRGLLGGGMQVGAHTVSHPILSTLNDSDAQREIVEGKKRLQEILGQSVTLFAYPNGKPDEDYSRRNRDIVADLGFEAAVSTAWGAAGPQTDCFQIPRFTPWDRSRWRFGLRLATNLLVSRPTAL